MHITRHEEAAVGRELKGEDFTLMTLKDREDALVYNVPYLVRRDVWRGG
jgi:hypothetical protein